jgi:quinol monooxygenase YgiN
VSDAPADDRRFMPQVGGDLPPGERPMVAVIRAVPGHEQPLAAAIATLTAAVRREPGCLEFRSFKDAANPGVFYLYEIYADTSAFRAHLTTDHVAHFFTELAQHSTADAQALVQLIELPAARGEEPPPRTPPRRGQDNEERPHAQGTTQTRRLNDKLSLIMLPAHDPTAAQLRSCALRRAACRVRWSRSGRLGAARAAWA